MSETNTGENNMKLENAIKKLKNAGYKIETNGTFYSAFLDGTEITFTAFENKTSKFTCLYPSSCSCTFGLTLKNAMS